jgi:hypothetical protein
LITSVKPENLQVGMIVAGSNLTLCWSEYHCLLFKRASGIFETLNNKGEIESVSFSGIGHLKVLMPTSR